MPNDPIDEMLKSFKASEQQLRVESIRTHIKFMDALSHRHQVWMKDEKGIETARLHLEILEAFQQARQKYTQLLEIHEKMIE